MPAIVCLGRLLSPTSERRISGGEMAILRSCLQLGAFLTGIFAWIICIVSTASVNRRVWCVENVKGIGSGNILIGIWAVCFWIDPNDDGNSFWQCEELNEQYLTLPKEIFIAQDLMALAAIMSSVALVCMSFALYNNFKPIKPKDFVLFFFSHRAFLNFFGGILVLISVTWNMSAVLQNGEIDFPETFGLPKIPSEQHIGPSIYIGYVAVGFQLMSASFFGMERICLKTTEACQIEIVKSKSETTCSNCSAVLNIVIGEESCAVEIKGSVRQESV